MTELGVKSRCDKFRPTVMKVFAGFDMTNLEVQSKQMKGYVKIKSICCWA
jgi:hypothetical protein